MGCLIDRDITIESQNMFIPFMIWELVGKYAIKQYYEKKRLYHP